MAGFHQDNSGLGTYSRRYCYRGLSLVEAVISLGIAALIAVLAFNALKDSPRKKWPKVTEAYFHHLSAAYSNVNLRYGAGPMTAVDSAGALVFTDGIEDFLIDWESTVTYDAGPPELLDYPEKFILYLDPEGLADDQYTNIPDPVMAGTDNKEWVLLDVNGTLSPNSLSSNGDRVLIYIDDDTGRILTAKQMCLEQDPDCTENYDAMDTFYDQYKGY
ncbi:MAG: hypothetical protein KTR14_03305 [Vampirovibrio sp.]|nr:hypothetical protein [Vampirovibrio sp.]